MSLKIGFINLPYYTTDCSLAPQCESRGWAIDAALIACSSLNLNCTFIEYPGVEFGDVDENGVGSGLVEEIRRGRFDATLPYMVPSFQRFRAVDFSHIFFSVDIVLITRAPNETTYDFNWSILYAFQWPVLLLFFLSLILIASVITTRSRRRADFLSFVDICSTLITKKYQSTVERLCFFRVLVTFWGLAAIVLGGAYAAVLFSQKVLAGNDVPFTDLKTFVNCLEEKRCRLIMPTTSINFYLQLIAPGAATSSRIENALGNNPLLIEPTVSEIPKIILRERDIFLVWLWPRDNFLFDAKGDKDCAYYIVDTPYKDSGTFSFKKNFSLSTDLNEMALSFQENGLSEAIRRKYISSVSCDYRKTKRAWIDEGHGLYSVRTIFYLYFLCVLGSAFALISELILVHFKAKLVQHIFSSALASK